MPNARTANAVRLEFAPDSLVHSNLSGAAFTGDWLWVAGDEACGLDRLRWQLPGLAELAEKIVVCGVPGLMENPAATHPLGDERVWAFFTDYRAYAAGQAGRHA